VRPNLSSGVILAVVVAIAIAGYLSSRIPSVVLTQADLIQKVERGEIASVTFDGGGAVEATTKPADTLPATTVRSYVVAEDESLVTALKAAKVPYGADEPSNCGNALPITMLFSFMIIIVLFNMLRPQQDAPNAARISRSQAKLAPEEGTGVSFKDVAGIDEAEEELNELVQFLKTPERFTRLGGKIPKGVLLVGPPGTGKTLLARAVAGEAGVPFFSLSGSDFMELYVGVGAARVRDLFKQAAERAPCIVFIDEIDAIGKARMAGVPGGGEGERDQTLNQLLVEMDGFDGRKGIILMAATNRPDTLDAALLRPGRFDRQVLVDRPDVRGREAILRVHAAKLALAPDVDLKRIAQVTPGFVGLRKVHRQARGGVWLAQRGIGGVPHEPVALRVDEQRLMRDAGPLARFAPVAGHPDDFADAPLPTEDAIAKHRGVMNRPVIEVEPQQAAVADACVDCTQSGFEPVEISADRRPSVVVRDRS